MKIPDCRTDKVYNEKYLNDKDAQYVLGFDHCYEHCMENFFNFVCDYEEELVESMSDDIAKKYLRIDSDVLADNDSLSELSDEEVERLSPLTKLLLTLKETMLEYTEGERDMLITSMITTSMIVGGKEHETYKEKVDSGETKNLITRYKEYRERFENGEEPTYWTYKKDEETGKMVKIGHCPNGNIVILKEDE